MATFAGDAMNLLETIPPSHDDAVWNDALAAIRSGLRNAPPRWEAIFGPLRTGLVDDLVVVGQIGQSIDGRIATVTGHSQYINGTGGLAHLHRLRALVDAVLIGVGTAVADDPQLTVRRVAGPNPAASLSIPMGGCAASARVLARRRRAPSRDHPRKARRPLPGVEHRPAARRRTNRAGSHSRGLAERGFRRILIEGGANTVSRFLAARCLDRLHVVVAPIIIGGGRSSLDACRRSRVRAGAAGADAGPSARRRGAARLRSRGSAGPDRAAKKSM